MGVHQAEVASAKTLKIHQVQTQIDTAIYVFIRSPEFVELDNNFSLEEYGPESLCFEQGSAWQQRSCTMLKQFRRFGSGCYRYKVRP